MRRKLVSLAYKIETTFKTSITKLVYIPVFTALFFATATQVLKNPSLMFDMETAQEQGIKTVTPQPRWNGKRNRSPRHEHIRRHYSAWNRDVRTSRSRGFK